MQYSTEVKAAIFDYASDLAYDKTFLGGNDFDNYRAINGAVVICSRLNLLEGVDLMLLYDEAKEHYKEQKNNYWRQKWDRDHPTGLIK